MTATQPLYLCSRLPVFQNRMFNSFSAARGCTTGDLVLIQDPDTGLIFNEAFQPELMVYGPDYHNEQGLSIVFQSHLQQVAGIIQQNFKGMKLVEVGCGKGQFLEILQAGGFDVVGMDPAYEGSNPAVLKRYFSHESGLKGDALILRHVLEHIQNPVAFLSNLRDANGGRGRIYIEVPCFDWICKRRAWFDIFYEHVNYFRLDDFHRMFGTVYDAGRIFSGQYLYAVADLATVRVPHRTDKVEFPADFLSTVAAHASGLNQTPVGQRVVWGAASKGVIFSLFMERAGAPIDTIIDINPAKQGKFIPLTALEVRSPAGAVKSLATGARIYVMNGNYLQEIQSLTNFKFQYTCVDNA